ncbi:4-oxalocrotonate tautomerase family protein [Halomonas desiderata]|uniref:4-oxalocrotonate tautomerase family protein n=1 Tax=Billgrantia desiderata TaxID=52021 RepID=UPI00174B7E79|nr:4-oxalocrotonate tautomerase family protein [Halomonas desiderata]
MPIATINIIEGRDAEKKQRLIENVARAISESLDAPLESVRVLVQEYPATHWGVGGETMQQRRSRQQ